MPFGNLSGPTLLVILFIVLLMFGAPKLPGLAKSIGQSMKILKKEVRGSADEGQSADKSASTDTQPSSDKPAAQNETAEKPASGSDRTTETGTDKP